MLRKLPILVCISSAFLLTLTFAKDVSASPSPDRFIDDLSEAMENASDDCEASLPASIQSAQGIVTMTRSSCAVMIRMGYEELKRARLSPRGYDLTTTRGLLRYSEAAMAILGRDAGFISSARDVAKFVPRDVIKDLLYGMVGVYLYLDHGIDPKTGLPVR